MQSGAITVIASTEEKGAVRTRLAATYEGRWQLALLASLIFDRTDAHPVFYLAARISHSLHAGYLTNLCGLLDRFTRGEPDFAGLAKPEMRPHGPSVVVTIIK